MQPFSQASMHLAHTSGLCPRHSFMLTTYAEGTAWGKGENMARREESPRLNSSGLTTGHTLMHSPQAVHSSSFTYLAFLRIFTSKLPTLPLTLTTSLMVRSL